MEKECIEFVILSYILLLLIYLNREFAVSQFAPIYARWSFPCFDEPALKVKFTIEMISPQNLTAVSNMPIKNSVESTE